MILLLALVAGLIAGFVRAKLNQQPYQTRDLRWSWLVLLAFIPQWLAFSFGPTRAALEDQTASLFLVLSQIGLLIFAIKNIRLPGFGFLAGGLVLNFVVILLNGGWMPISPETVKWLDPSLSSDAWQIGERFRAGKDIVLEAQNTRLWFLSDRFRWPVASDYRVAFSLGDVLIGFGAFWLCWSFGGKPNKSAILEVKNELGTM